MMFMGPEPCNCGFAVMRTSCYFNHSSICKIDEAEINIPFWRQQGSYAVFLSYKEIWIYPPGGRGADLSLIWKEIFWKTVSGHENTRHVSPQMNW